MKKVNVKEERKALCEYIDNAKKVLLSEKKYVDSKDIYDIIADAARTGKFQKDTLIGMIERYYNDDSLWAMKCLDARNVSDEEKCKMRKALRETFSHYNKCRAEIKWIFKDLNRKN